MANINVNRPQSPYTCSAFGGVRVAVDQDLELTEHSDQKACKVPVNNSREVGP